jgi:hypothetical protein
MKKYKIYGMLILVILFVSSCTDLEETLYSEIPDGEFYQNKEQVMSAIYRPWSHFSGSMSVGSRTWILEELSADAVAWPQKGRHGYDGGNWIRLHRHTWTDIDDSVKESWSNLYQGIGFANKIIQDLEKLDFDALKVPMPKNQAIAELKIYRAYCYWNLMDLYGSVPIPTTITEKNPSTKTSTEVFNFIEKEILDNINNLSTDKATTYGRASKFGAYSLLARLYLNAETYTGTAQWDKCIAACNEVIASGKYQLDAQWNTPFKVNNDKVSNENIWVIAYDQVYAGGMGWYQRWFHYSQQAGWKLESGMWNALVIQPSFYDSFASTDKRKTEGMLMGPQYERVKNPDGTYSFDTTKPLKGSEEYSGKPLVFVNTIASMEKGEENSGARSVKYEIVEGATGNQSNDWVVFRYADILMMKAEALMRKNNNTATTEVINLVNSVRERAFDLGDPAAKYTTSTLTLLEFLAERGREFAFEGYRRTDLIRFKQFTSGTWWDKNVSDSKANLFPIPGTQFPLNPNLKPNSAN